MTNMRRDQVWNILITIAAVTFAAVIASCGGGDQAFNPQADVQGILNPKVNAQDVNSGARVVWNSDVLQVTVLQGTSQQSSIQFTVSAPVNKASVFVARVDPGVEGAEDEKEETVQLRLTQKSGGSRSVESARSKQVSRTQQG